ARLRPMRGLKRLRSVQTISTGHALVRNIRCGHYELAVDTDAAVGCFVTPTTWARRVACSTMKNT
ncbi:transposase, partial [Frankia sp. Mgl5]|nr:transposase [Frankia sp. Mgl5]